MYSETYDYYLLLPMKTATTHVSWVFRYFDFLNYTRITLDDGTKKDFQNVSIMQTHDCYIPDEITNPKSIITTRNPYYRILSYFLFTQNPYVFETPSPESFTEYLKSLPDKKGVIDTLFAGIDSNPTHVIRQETLYEDYCKIDFIKNSDLNEMGILRKICDKRINENRHSVNKSDYLTEYNKELIYDIMKPIFEKFGYDK